MINFIKKHRILFTVLLAILALCSFFLPQIIIKLPFCEKEKILGIELIALCAEITSAFFVIVGSIIAVWQYYLSSSQKIKEFQFSKIKKAIELSEYYKDNILNRYSCVKKVFDEYGITPIIESKRKNLELKYFDIEELKTIYTEGEIEKFRNLKTDEKFIEAIVKVNLVYNMNLNGCEKTFEYDPSEEGRVTKRIEANPQEIVADFFNKYIVDTLNNAEYFAMAFTHNVADESVIFQSIYPTYLEMCFIMFYYISHNSDPRSAKLYTNVAELYCTWREKERQQKAKMSSHSRNEGKDLGTVAE